jgi:hypothetical protein
MGLLPRGAKDQRSALDSEKVSLVVTPCKDRALMMHAPWGSDGTLEPCQNVQYSSP